MAFNRVLLAKRILHRKNLFRLPIRNMSSQNILLEIRKFNKSNTKLGKEKKAELESLIKVLFQDLTSHPRDEPLFLQSVEEVLSSLKPFLLLNPKYLELLPILCMPEQTHMFQVSWLDDEGIQRVNNGYRVQFNQALGPYKGGIRFHPSVDLSTMKFLGFEQAIKNGLTCLPMGGAKGGADFDPKGKSQREIYEFCKSFMRKLVYYIGPDRDVPAGDIGVGGREIGYLYGEYKSLTHSFHGSLTGKQVGWGGSHLRPQATGYGLIYITDCYLKKHSDTLEGKRCLVSGSGNVAQFAAEKLIEFKAKVLTLSDSNGTIYNKDGFTKEQLADLMKLKDNRQRCSQLVNLHPSVQYYEKKCPWSIKKEADLAFPCATQNEINKDHAMNLVEMKCLGVFEGANMPSTSQAIDIYRKHKLAFIPGKAANAGGVAVSGLEMAQNSARMQWEREKVDQLLKEIMKNIYKVCDKMSTELGHKNDIQLGANTVGFKRVADAMFQQGMVFHPDM